jgi:hypothetical protein
LETQVPGGGRDHRAALDDEHVQEQGERSIG